MNGKFPILDQQDPIRPGNGSQMAKIHVESTLSDHITFESNKANQYVLPSNPCMTVKPLVKILHACGVNCDKCRFANLSVCCSKTDSSCVQVARISHTMNSQKKTPIHPSFDQISAFLLLILPVHDLSFCGEPPNHEPQTTKRIRLSIPSSPLINVDRRTRRSTTQRQNSPPFLTVTFTGGQSACVTLVPFTLEALLKVSFEAVSLDYFHEMNFLTTSLTFPQHIL